VRHLTPEALVDVAEGMRAERSEPHLAGCDVCRLRVASLRRTMSEVSHAAVPEPSPLFWDHLSARVREAVEAERPGAAPLAAYRSGWWSWRVWVPAAGLIVAIALGVTVRDRSRSAAASSAAVSDLPALQPLGSADDPSLRLIAVLTTTLDEDEASDAMSMPVHAGAIDEAVIDLSASERQELNRLLAEELARPGA
jgi:hypothetical protein